MVSFKTEIQSAVFDRWLELQLKFYTLFRKAVNFEHWFYF